MSLSAPHPVASRLRAYEWIAGQIAAGHGHAPDGPEHRLALDALLAQLDRAHAAVRRCLSGEETA